MQKVFDLFDMVRKLELLLTLREERLYFLIGMGNLNHGETQLTAFFFCPNGHRKNGGVYT